MIYFPEVSLLFQELFQLFQTFDHDSRFVLEMGQLINWPEGFQFLSILLLF